MKKRLIAGLLSAFPLLMMAEQVNVVTVTTPTNQKIHWRADSKPHCYFSDEAVTLQFMDHTPPIDVEYPMEEFKSISYGREDSGITSDTDLISSPGAEFTLTSDAIIASGLPSYSQVEVYSVSGLLEAVVQVGGDGSCVVSTANLPAGAHIIKSAPITYKFIKK